MWLYVPLVLWRSVLNNFRRLTSYHRDTGGRFFRVADTGGIYTKAIPPVLLAETPAGSGGEVRPVSPSAWLNVLSLQLRILVLAFIQVQL
jgi:hypothetical protein